MFGSLHSISVCATFTIYCLPFLPYSFVVKDEYKKLEVLAFEMETTIASLEEELSVAHKEKDEATSQAEGLSCELHTLSEELNMSKMELATLKEEVSCLVSCSAQF